MSKPNTIYTIMTDYGSAYGWIVRDGDESRLGGNHAGFGGWDGDHPISDELQQEFAKWQSEYESAGWLQDKGRNSFDWPRFHAQGIELARRLKVEIGDRARIVYEKAFEDPHHLVEERRELLNDGSLLLLRNRAQLFCMPFRHVVMKIVSGGQTGVDRAALDWAIDHDMTHGGWCPKGRIAEDGVLEERYRLQETESEGYRQRTRQNVIDSDGTLILNTGELSEGTLTTLRFAERFEKPCLVMQLDTETESIDVRRVMEWVRACGVTVLNIAGPRESKRPGVYQKTLVFLGRLTEHDKGI